MRTHSAGFDTEKFNSVPYNHKAMVDTLRLVGGITNPSLAPRMIQRKCNCGGTCPKCKEKRRLEELGVQPSLIVNTPGDKWELEADRIASRVISMPDRSMTHDLLPSSAQSAMRKESIPRVKSSRLPKDLSLGQGSPLEESDLDYFNSRFGEDFSSVRIHTDKQANRVAQALEARAFTYGNNIVFSGGEYATSSRSGRHLLAHELTHVLQQGSPNGSRAIHSSIQRQPSVANPGAAGGCGICLPQPHAINAGNLVHAHVQAAFQAMYPNHMIIAERGVSLGNEATPRLDLYYADEEGIHFGEIKPFNARQTTLGLDEIRDYFTALTFDPAMRGLNIFRMRLTPPTAIPFFNPSRPPLCPVQLIYVEQTAPGLYQYFCEAPWSSLVAMPNCQCNATEDERQEQLEQIGALPSIIIEDYSAIQDGLFEQIPHFAEGSWPTIERITAMVEYALNAPRELGARVLLHWVQHARGWLGDFITGVGHALRSVFGIGGSISDEEFEHIFRSFNQLDDNIFEFWRSGSVELLQRIIRDMAEVTEYIQINADWEHREDLSRGAPYIAAGVVVIALAGYLAAPLVAGAGGATAVGTEGAAGATVLGEYATATGVRLVLYEGGQATTAVVAGQQIVAGATVTQQTAQILAAAGAAAGIIGPALPSAAGQDYGGE